MLTQTERERLHREIAKNAKLATKQLETSAKMLAAVNKTYGISPVGKCRLIEFPVNLHIKKTAL